MQVDNRGQQRLVAYVVLNGQPLDINQPRASWKHFLQLSLPEYMIPHEFVALESLPLTTSGKVARNTLPKVTTFSEHHSDSYVAPTNQTEGRSEERRVGKEGRSRSWTNTSKNESERADESV